MYNSFINKTKVIFIIIIDLNQMWSRYSQNHLIKKQLLILFIWKLQINSKDSIVYMDLTDSKEPFGGTQFDVFFQSITIAKCSRAQNHLLLYFYKMHLFNIMLGLAFCCTALYAAVPAAYIHLYKSLIHVSRTKQQQ